MEYQILERDRIRRQLNALKEDERCQLLIAVVNGAYG